MKRSKQLFWVVGSYVVLTSMYLFPLFRNFTTDLAGHGDAWQFVWNFWWVDKVFSTPSIDLFYTTFLHWPQGVSLLLQTMTLVNSVPAALLSNFFSLVATYNLLIILHFILSGLAMYFLCYHISKNHFAAFIGGFLFAFSPYRFAHYYGHLHLLTTEILPFAILFLIKTLEGNRRAWIGAAIFCALAVYTDLYYFLFLFLVSLALVIWKFPRTRAIVFRLLLIAAITALAAAPYLGPMLVTRYQTQEFDVLGHDPVTFSGHLKSFLVPGGRSLFNVFTESVWAKWPGWREDGAYVGWSVLLLLSWGFLAPRSSVRSGVGIFWAIVGAFFAVLSLGPKTLLYAWFVRIFPLFALAGVASRFFVITTVALSILVSLVLSKQKKFVSVIFFIVLAFEYLPSPVVTSPIVVSEFYRQLAADSASYGIIDLSDNMATVLYYQTIHGKSLVGGYVSRGTVSANQFLETTPVIQDLVAEGEKFRTHAPPKNGRAILQGLSVKYILIEPDDTDELRYVKNLGIPSVYQDADLAAYQVY